MTLQKFYRIAFLLKMLQKYFSRLRSATYGRVKTYFKIYIGHGHIPLKAPNINFFSMLGF